MLEGRRFRDLLIAELAVEQGVATAGQVADALRACQAERDAGGGEPRTVGNDAGGGADVADVLVRIAGLEPGRLASVVAEADRVLAAARGEPGEDARDRASGVRSIHLALSRAALSASRVLAEARAGGRAALRPLPEGRYTDFLVAGEGGMGVVYMALDTDLNRFVALKMVRPDAGSRALAPTPVSPLLATPPPVTSEGAELFEELKARFLQEAWVTGGLEHPGIVPVYELGETPSGVPYFTMRFVPGQRTLAHAIEEVAGEPIERRLALLEPYLKVCDALAYAHARGVVHRDVKPQNVALGEYGEVVLLDWGLAKLDGPVDRAGDRWKARIRELRDTADLATLAAGVGTPGYMSPEAARGDLERVGPRSDVYSLGMILFQLLTGRLPERPRRYLDYVAALSSAPAADPAGLDPAVPRELAELCRAATDPSPERRPAGVDELAAAIRRWQASTALERELEGQRRAASEAVERAEPLHGAARLAHIDRAAAALHQVLSRRPDDPPARALEERVASLRQRGLAEHQAEVLRRSRRRLLTVAGAVLVLAGVGYLGTIVQSALSARADRRARAEREQAAEAALARAEGLEGAAAVAALEEVVSRFGESTVRPRARLSLGDRLRADGRRERGLATWIECALLDAPSPASTRAWRRIARTFLDEGSPVRAMEALASALRATRDAGAREALLLLWAEAAWAQGAPEPAHRLVKRVRSTGSLDPEDAARADALSATLPCLSTLWRLPGGHCDNVVAGRFRDGRRELAIGRNTPRRCEIRSVDRDGVGPRPRCTWTREEEGYYLGAFDFDRDGIDELVEIAFPTRIPVGTDRLEPGVLRVLDLRGAEPVTRCRREVPHGGYAMAAGDFDGDGDVDLVLGCHHPGRGLCVLENTSAPGRLELTWRTEPEFLGGLGGGELLDANIRAVAIDDVDGDGRNEILIGSAEWRMYTLVAVRWNRTTRRFDRLGVARSDGGSDRLGLLNGLIVRDADLDGRKDVVFATDAIIYDRLKGAAADFVPQGLHQASWEEASARLGVRPLFTDGARIRIDPAPGDADALPVNQGTSHMIAGRVGPGREWVVTGGMTFAGKAKRADWVRVHAQAFPWPGGTTGPPCFTFPVDGAIGSLEAADLDGDERDELLLLTQNGELTARALVGDAPTGGVNLPEPPDAEPETTGATTRLDVGAWLGRLGWPALAEAQYRSYLGEHPGESPETLSHEALVASITRQWRWEEAIARLEERLVPGRLHGAELKVRLAEVLDRTQAWREAGVWYADALETGLTADLEGAAIAQRARDLAAWRAPTLEALPEPDAWSVSEPGYFRLEGSTITGQEADGQTAGVWLPVALDGSSFRLRFELRIDALGHGHTLQLGFMRPDVPKPYFSPGLCMLVTTNSMLARHVRVGPEVGQLLPLDGGDEQPRSLDPGVPYRGDLAWDASGRVFSLVLRRADEPRIVCALTCRPRDAAPLDPDAPDRHDVPRLGVRIVTDGWIGGSSFQVRLLALERPEGAGRLLPLPPPDLLGAVHRLLAQGRAPAALQAYRALVSFAGPLGAERAHLARFLAALLAFEQRPADGPDAALELAEDGQGPRSCRRLLHGRDLLLVPPARLALAKALFRRSFTRWRAARDAGMDATSIEALYDSFLAALDLYSASGPDPLERVDDAGRRLVIDRWLTTALRDLSEPPSDEERAALRAALQLDPRQPAAGASPAGDQGK